jgi:hypothetical protein
MVLGEIIPLRELISGYETAVTQEKYYDAFLTPTTIDRILDMTQEWYSSYANTFPLRI